MSWTDERVERLKTLWADGLSASQIAAELGNVTRNAVIGKVHRLGLSGRAKPQVQAARPQPAPRAKTPAPAPRPAQPAPRPAAARPITIGNVAVKPTEETAAPAPAPVPARASETEPVVFEKVTILHLTEQTCKWPIGDPGRPDFFFCGRRSDSGIPYCGYHARIAYQPSADRKLREKRQAV